VAKERNSPTQLLIVNYHPDTNRAMEKLLGLSGYQARSAISLAQAEQILAAGKIDLMLCRISACDGDGAEFIERMHRRFAVPSLAIAGSIENQSRAARLSAKAMRGIIGMPADLKMLLASIAAALADSKQRPGVCHDCRGQGSILLLTSSRPCASCQGTGVQSMCAIRQRV
jgi:DNA-binding NtrC family response regulator